MYFSIIIPLYNKADYILRCINSVLNQQYLNYEIIVIDDGSTDGGAEVLKRLNDPKITLHQQINKGVSIARNIGVSLSKYDYVTFLDADDTWEKEYLINLKQLIEDYPHCGIYGLNHYYSLQGGKITFDRYANLFAGKQSGIIHDYFKLFATLQRSPFSNSNCCYPKSVFLEMGGYQPEIRLTEDSDLWCRIALKYNVAFSTLPLATYFVETPNNTRAIIEDDDFQVTKTLINKLESNQVKPEFIDSIIRLIAFQELSLVRRAILHGAKFLAFKKLFKKHLFQIYHVKIMFYLFMLLFPTIVVLKINKLLTNRE